MRLADLTPIERRVLDYLAEHGPTHRERVVVALADPNRKIRGYGSGRANVRGSNGATPLIMGKWCSRLSKAGLVRDVRSDDTWWAYRHHTITEAGRRLLKGAAPCAS